MIEGVLLMPDPTQTAAQAAQAQAAGLPSPMVNVTLRPDAQRIYASLRDKEGVTQAVGAEQMSPTDIYAAMLQVKDKAILLDYGTVQPNREVVMMADLEDPQSHKLFGELAARAADTLNLRLVVFPVAMEEIRPQSLDRAAALLCHGFPQASPEARKVTATQLWKSFMTDPLTATNPAQAWTDWAKAQGIQQPAAEACPQLIEPGIFTRLAGSLGLSGTPRVLLPSGKSLMGSFSVDDLIKALAEPLPAATPAATPTPATSP
jgi:protein-disulfide isomerase